MSASEVAENPRWLQFGFASAIGASLAAIALGFLFLLFGGIGDFGIRSVYPLGVIDGPFCMFVFGAGVGWMQARLLKSQGTILPLWVLATAGGGFLGGALGVIASPHVNLFGQPDLLGLLDRGTLVRLLGPVHGYLFWLLGLMLFGFSVGSTQWVLSLRKPNHSVSPVLWIPLSTVAWSIAWAIGWVSDGGFLIGPRAFEFLPSALGLILRLLIGWTICGAVGGTIIGLFWRPTPGAFSGRLTTPLSPIPLAVCSSQLGENEYIPRERSR